MSKLLKFDDVVAAVEELAAGREDYVYQHNLYPDSGTCSNIHFEQVDDAEDERYSRENIDRDSIVPGCIVGAYAIESLKIDGVDIWDSQHEDSGSEALTAWIDRRGEYTFTARARHFLSQVQASQDAGLPWGEAIKWAKRGTRAYKMSRAAVEYGGDKYIELTETTGLEDTFFVIPRDKVDVALESRDDSVRDDEIDFV